MKTNGNQNSSTAKAFLTLICFVLLSVIANATAKIWTGATSTDWNTASNWSPSGIPGSADDVTIPTSPTGGRMPLLTGGSATVHNFIIQSAATMSMSGGILIVYADWRNSGTFSATGGTVEFAATGSGSAFPTAGSNQFYNIIVDASKDPSFDNYTVTINIAGDFTNNNTSLNETPKCTFSFNGTSSQNIYSAITSSNATFGNLSINNSTTVNLTSNALTAGDLTISNGTFNLSTYTANRKSSGGTLSIASGATLQLGGTTGGQTGSNFPSSFNSITLSSGSTVQYNASNSTTQTIYTTPYSNLTLSNLNGTGTATKTTAANITVSGNLTVDTTVTLSPGAAYTVGGTGTLTGYGSVEVTRNIAVADFPTQYPITNQDLSNLEVIYHEQPLTSVNYKSLTLNGYYTLTRDMTVTSALTINSGSLDLNGYTLTLKGKISGTGTIKSSSTSAITITSSGTVGTLNFDQTTDGTSNNLGTLTVNNGTVTLGSKLNLYTQLNVAGGTLNLNGKNLVLKSNANGTASLSQVVGALSGATNVTVERYIPNDGRKYRILTPGVTTTSSIKANWMEGGMNTSWGTNVNPSPGYGTQITGSGGNTNGFDYTPTNSPSLYSYNNATQSWVAVTNTNATMNANQPYLIFIRGDRSVDLTATGTTLPSTATTLRATGTLQVGDQSVSSLAGNGNFSLVGNPFASSVDWSNVSGDTRNNGNFQNSYTYWDPTIGTRGSYVTVTNNGFKSNNGAHATTHIQSGQGFFIQSKTGVSNPSFYVNNSYRSNSNNNSGVFRTASQMPQLNTSLYFYDSNKTRINADGVSTVFDNSFSADVDDDDAIQIANWDEDIALKRNGKSLSIESRPLITSNDTLFLAVARLKVQQYEWQFDPANLNAQGLTAFLVDNYLNTQTPISLSQPSFIGFNVTSDAASSGANRFYITFRTAIVLPVKLVSFSGKRSNDDNELNWGTATEDNFDHFELLYSTDQNNFTTIATIQGKGSASDYSFMHKNVTSNVCYYRLKMVDKNGATSFSNIVLIKRNDIDISVNHVYPNPFTDELTVDINSQVETKATIYLLDMQGKQIRKLPISVSKGTNSISLQNLHVLGAGMYMLSVKSDTFEFNTQVVKGNK